MVPIRKNLVSSSKYSIKCPYSMTAQGITIHNTQNNASANNEIAYMIRNDKQVSFHYAIDDKEIVQGLLENRNGWHAGDGGNGKGNRTTIGIEICYSTGDKTKFEKAQENTAEFVAYKLKEKGWGVDRIYPHKHWSGKHCPHRTLDDYGWDYFINLVKKYLKKIEEESKPKPTPKPTQPVTPTPKPTPQPVPTPKQEEEEEEVTQEQFNKMMEVYLQGIAKEPASDWAKGDLAWAKEEGLINGDEKGNQMPHKFMTRQELAAVLHRYDEKK